MTHNLLLYNNTIFHSTMEYNANKRYKFQSYQEFDMIDKNEGRVAQWQQCRVHIHK